MGERKKDKKCAEGTPDWLLTFGDLNALLLTFFVLLVSMATFEKIEVRLILSAFQGSFGIFPGGTTLTEGRMASLGNTIESLPSTDNGKGMAKAFKAAVSLFQSEIKNRKVKIDINERGIIISLTHDAYFKKASAELDIDTARSVLEKVALLLTRTDFRDKNIRIEGHADIGDTDPYGPWPTNWDLAADRALNVLKYLVDFGADPKKFAAVSYGEYMPIASNDTEEGMSKNRRVDILIMRDE